MRVKLLLAGLAMMLAGSPALAQQPPSGPSPEITAAAQKVADKAAAELDKQRAQAPTPPPPLDPANVLVFDLSNGGQVKILLRPDKAPGSVDRIKTLVRQGFYNGLIFHRVISGFMAQGGDPKGDGTGGSELPDLKAEFNDLPHLRGTMSMARAESPDSANSQFFIMLLPNLALDGRYTAIGRVIAGMDAVDRIELGEPPENPTKILRASIEGDGAAVVQPQPQPEPQP